MYEIGSTTFFKGDEITITTTPYELYGAMWQDGEKENGDIVTVKTPEQSAADVAKIQSDWKEQQSNFSNLHK